MKRAIVLSLISVCMFATCTSVAAKGRDLTSLTREELETFKEDIDVEKELHHEVQSTEESAVLDAVKEKTLEYMADIGTGVSWPWLDYEYTKDWDFYTLETSIDYKDKNDKSKDADVYAELMDTEYGTLEIYYLIVGKELVIDNRKKLPDNLWIKEPTGTVNEATGEDLAKFTVEELDELEEAIDAEIEANHKPKTEIETKVLDLVEAEVEKEYTDVSWPWFDYDYTNDWGLYTLKTPIEYGESNKDADVYAEAYTSKGGEYELYYLTVGYDTLIDKRDKLPKNLAKTAKKKAKEEKKEEVETQKETAEEFKIHVATPTPEPDVVLYEKGTSGADVQDAQAYLITLGYLSGAADGIFGDMTKAALEKFQTDNHLEVTGSITKNTFAVLQDKARAKEIADAKAREKELEEKFISTTDAHFVFEDFGDMIYPYGFKCHWFLDLRAEERYDDGSVFLKVGVTIKNAYGTKLDTVAEGRVVGTSRQAAYVEDFYVY